MLTWLRSYDEACYLLGASNLSVLELEPGCIEWTQKGYYLGTGTCFSMLKERWDIFCQWAGPEPQARFSWLVTEWCSRRSSRKTSSIRAETNSSAGDHASSQSSLSSSPAQETDASSIDTHLEYLSTTPRNVCHNDDADIAQETNLMGQDDGAQGSTQPLVYIPGLRGRPPPGAGLTDPSGTSDDHLDVVPSPASDKPFSQFESLPVHHVSQCSYTDTVGPGGKRRRLDCSDWAGSGVSEAQKSMLGTCLPDTTIADPPFSDSTEYNPSAIGSMERHSAVTATQDGNWTSSYTPTIAEAVRGVELAQTFWPTDDFETGPEFVTDLWGDGLDFAPGQGGPMEHGQLDC